MSLKRVDVKVSTVIRRETEAVFEYVANYENDPLWRAGVISMRHDPPGPAHVGMRTHGVFRFFGRTLYEETEIVELCANVSVSFQTVSGPLQAEEARRIEAVPSGTNFTFEASVQLTGLLGWFAPLVTWSFRRRAKADLARLRKILETNADLVPA